MSGTGIRRTWLLALLLPLCAGPVPGCGGESQEQQLAQASQELQEARRTVERKEAKVDAIQADLEKARKELASAQERLQRAESRVDLKATDAALFRAVQKRLLEDERLREVAIRADVAQGIVTLHGNVPRSDLREYAEQLAAGVPGVVRVENLVRVEGGEKKT
jgi:hyperosmotically inducible protein